MEILLAWERWTGPAGGFYTALGADAKRMASIIGRGKKLKREGRVPVSEFKEITDAVLGGATPSVARKRQQFYSRSWRAAN